MIKSKKAKLYILISAFFASLIIFSSLNSYALDNPAITVTPGVINVELTESNQIIETEIEISSNYEHTTILNTSLSGVEDSTGVLVANGPLKDDLKQSMSLSNSKITVPANGNTKISLSIKNTDQLSPGGHYAAVTLSQVSDQNAQINLQSTISISIFIVKRGGEKVDISVEQQSLKLSLFSIPTTATLKYLNTGNVALTPRASITVRSMDGTVVYAKGVSNEGSLSILPNLALEDSFSIVKTSKFPFIPTKLKYITEYRADGVANAKYTELHQWYIPPVFIILTLLLFLLTAVMIFKFFKRKQQKTKMPKKTLVSKNGIGGGLISDITPVPKKK